MKIKTDKKMGETKSKKGEKKEKKKCSKFTVYRSSDNNFLQQLLYQQSIFTSFLDDPHPVILLDVAI